LFGGYRAFGYQADIIFDSSNYFSIVIFALANCIFSSSI
jgi:hypothetical protein